MSLKRRLNSSPGTLTVTVPSTSPAMPPDPMTSAPPPPVSFTNSFVPSPNASVTLLAAMVTVGWPAAFVDLPNEKSPASVWPKTVSFNPCASKLVTAAVVS